MNEIKLTIIIPSINRPEYLKRSLEYWEQSDFQIIIVTNVELSHPKIKIINSNESFFKRIGLALNESNGKYCLICPDDDFLGFNSLNKCIQILDEDPKCSSVVGNVGSFSIEPNSQINFSPIYEMPEHCESDVNLRIKSGFVHYSNNYWVVYRRSVFEKILTVSSELKNFNVAEMIFKLGALLEGNIRSCRQFFWLREVIPGSWGGKESCGLTYLESPKNIQELEYLNEMILNVFGEKAFSPIPEMLENYKLFLNNRNKKKLSDIIIETLKKTIKKLIPYKRLRPQRKGLSLLKIEEKEDFDRMKKIIEKFGSLSK